PLVVSPPALPRALHSFPTRRSSDLSPISASCRITAFIPMSAPLPMVQLSKTAPWPTVTSSPTIVAPRALTCSTQLSCMLVRAPRSEEHTSELQSRENLVFRLLLEKK